MKKIFLFFVVAIIAFPNLNAQLKYRSDGRLTLGNVEPTGSYSSNIKGWGHYFTGDDQHPGTFYKVCVVTAAPRLSGTLDQIVFYNSETSTFNNIQVGTVYNMSDKRFKINIQPVDNALNKIKNLNPVSYNWRESLGSEKLKTFGNTGKVQKDLGFLAQEVEQVIPDAVYDATDSSTDYKLLNYNAILSVVTEAVKELSNKVDSLQAELDSLKAVNALKTLSDNSFTVNNSLANNISSDSPLLYQNAPNPYNNQTIISYYIPSSSQSSSLRIYDISGRAVFQKNILSKGKGQTIINSQQITSPGMYFYSLSVDNKLIDTKKMLLTK